MAGSGNKRRPGVGFALVVTSSLCWSSMPVLIKLGLNSGLSEIPLNAIRLSIGAATLGLFMLFFSRRFARRMPPRLIIFLILIGVIDYGLGGLLFFTGIRYLGASLASLLIFTYPALVLIISVAAGWERITLHLVLALLLTFLGATLVLEAGFALAADTWIGIACVLGTVLIFTIYILYCERLLERYSSAQISFYSLAGGGLAMLALLPLFPVPLADVLRPANLLLLAFIGVVSTAFSLILFMKGIRYIGVSRASILTTIEPVLIVFLAWLLLGETLSWMQIVGVVVQLCGVAMLRWERSTPAPSAP